MNTLSSIIAFIRYILPWTKSTVKDLKVVLGAIEEGIEALERDAQYPFDYTKKRIVEAKESI
jgi:hypothetical protein